MNTGPQSAEVVESYISLKKQITNLRLRELAIYRENEQNMELERSISQAKLNSSSELETKLDFEIPCIVSDPSEWSRDCSMNEGGDNWVQDLSPEKLETWIQPSDEFKEYVSNDPLWQQLKDIVIQKSHSHQADVKRLKNHNNGVKKNMILDIIDYLDTKSQSITELYLSEVDWSLSPFGVSWNELANDIEAKQNLKGTYGIKKGVSLAEMVRCSKRYARDVNYGRYELTTDIKQDVCKRDNDQCVCCSSAENLKYHHIIPASRGGRGAKKNIALLCHACHCDVHQGGGNWSATVYNSKNEFWDWVNNDSKILLDYHTHSPTELEKQIPIKKSTLYKLEQTVFQDLQAEGVDTIGDFVNTPVRVLEEVSSTSRQLERWKHDGSPGLDLSSISGIDDDVRWNILRQYSRNESRCVSIEDLREATIEELESVDGVSLKSAKKLHQTTNYGLSKTD